MKLNFQVTGMTCAACSARVEKVTRAVAGVEKAEVNLLAGKMSVEASSDVSAAIEQAVIAAGYADEWERIQENMRKILQDERVVNASTSPVKKFLWWYF
jgi:Cu2+-exporting ATPase